jgi:hypothetical protein
MKCNFHIKLPTFLAPLLLLFKITLDLLTKKLKKKKRKEKEKAKALKNNLTHKTLKIIWTCNYVTSQKEKKKKKKKKKKKYVKNTF